MRTQRKCFKEKKKKKKNYPLLREKYLVKQLNLENFMYFTKDYLLLYKRKRKKKSALTRTVLGLRFQERCFENNAHGQKQLQKCSD